MSGWLRHTRVRLTIGHAALFTVLASGIAATFWLVLRSVEYGNIDAALKFDAEEVISNVQDVPVLAPASLPFRQGRRVEWQGHLDYSASASANLQGATPKVDDPASSSTLPSRSVRYSEAPCRACITARTGRPSRLYAATSTTLKP